MSYESFIDKHFPNLSAKERGLLLTTESVSKAAVALMGGIGCGVGVGVGYLFGSSDAMTAFVGFGAVCLGFTMYNGTIAKERYSEMKAAMKSQNN